MAHIATAKQGVTILEQSRQPERGELSQKSADFIHPVRRRCFPSACSRRRGSGNLPGSARAQPLQCEALQQLIAGSLRTRTLQARKAVLAKRGLQCHASLISARAHKRRREVCGPDMQLMETRFEPNQLLFLVQDMAEPEHTALLLKCYTKLKDFTTLEEQQSPPDTCV